MARRKTDPYTTQALNASIVRYGPELSALTALLKQAEEDRDLRYRQAKSGRQRGVGAVDAAVPQIQSAYQGAANAITPAFAAQGGLESGALGARMGEAQALAQSQLAARRVSAIEGEGAARTQALKDFRSDQSKIGSRYTDVQREMGAFASSTIADLNAADAKALADAASQQASLTQSERNSVRSSGIDPDTGLPIPGGKLDPDAPSNKPKPREYRTPQQHADFSSLVNDITKFAAPYAGKKPRSWIVGKLQQGRPEASGWYAKNPEGKWVRVAQNTPGAQYKTKTKIPQFRADVAMSAALDVALAGHLSKTTQDRLRKAGLRVADLGLPTYGQWKKLNYEERIRRGEVAGPPDPRYRG